MPKVHSFYLPLQGLLIANKKDAVMNIRYLLHSGKNSKLKYYVLEYIHYWLPSWLFRRQLCGLLDSACKRRDKEYILKRVDYYNKMDEVVELPNDARTIGNHKLSNRKGNKVYLFDTHHYLKYFDPKLNFVYEKGDVTYIPKHPALVKSRPVDGDNRNSVVLNEDKVRHFVFVNDHKSFEEKKNVIFFRGETKGKPHRQRFLEMYFNHPMCNLGDVTPQCEETKKYFKPKITIRQHLDYKFIMALEGNDVASYLKWVMSSNSIAVMPRPKYETWFMEGTLKPDYHYIEIRPDYSDLIEKCNYYIAHPDEAEAIITHAHEFIAQFKDKKREKIISLLVLDKYFRFTR